MLSKLNKDIQPLNSVESYALGLCCGSAYYH